MDLGNRGKLREATEAFLQSNRLAPNPTVTVNIALGLEGLHHYEEAFSFFSEALELAGGPEETEAARAGLERILPKVARLRVETEPAGATIFLDRKNLGEFGRTPRLFAAELGDQGGRREVIVEADGYHPVRATVSLERGKVAEVSLVLERILGTVAVTSDPAGATIRSGGETGEPLGTTPGEVSLPPGTHELVLTLAGPPPGRGPGLGDPHFLGRGGGPCRSWPGSARRCRSRWSPCPCRRGA